MNEKEAYEIEKIFLKLNKSGDGKLSKAEFVHGMKNTMGTFGANAV